nr:protein SMG9-like [Ipomoea trifida]
MSSTGGNASSSTAPKILLAKPGLVTAGKFNRGGADDDSAALRPRIPSIGSLNLLSDSWELHTDRFLPVITLTFSVLARKISFLTDNTDFTVVGVIGPPGVGKSTIMNEIYGFDSSSPGMLPPFAIQSEEIRAMAKHCTVGIEPRVSSERIILLDSQPVFSPSVLAEMIRPDGSSTISVITGESLSAELAHEMMSIQVDLLKHGIPDPSSLSLSHPQSSSFLSEKENKDKNGEGGEEYMATPVFVHTKLRDEDLNPHNLAQLRKGLSQFFSSSSFMRSKCHYTSKDTNVSVHANSQSHKVDSDSQLPKLFLLPSKHKDNLPRAQYESYESAFWKLRDQVLSMSGPSFSRTVSERDWLKNSAKIWDLVRNSSIIADYCKTLQTSGMFRR